MLVGRGYCPPPHQIFCMNKRKKGGTSQIHIHLQMGKVDPVSNSYLETTEANEPLFKQEKHPSHK